MNGEHKKNREPIDSAGGGRTAHGSMWAMWICCALMLIVWLALLWR